MEYRAISSESFWNLEMIQIAINIKGMHIDDLRKFIMEGDFLDYSTKNTLIKKVGKLVKRFNFLDEVLVEELATGDTRTTEFITFYSIIKNDKIVFDFLNEVIFSDFMKLKKYITREEVDNFLIEKARQFEEVRSWSDTSKHKLKNKIVEFCTKGGYLVKQKEDYSITWPSVNKRTREHLAKIESNEMNNILFFQKEV